MDHEIKIGKKKIGQNNPVYIIAEAGVNHNGSFNRAKDLIISAAECGADCIKFQTFTAEKVVSKTSPKPPYQIKNTGRNKTQFDMLKQLEIPKEWYPLLMDLCQEKGLDFMSTPYDVDSIFFLQEIGVKAFKVPSALLVEKDYLNNLAKIGKPIFLATGMCSFSEVAAAVEIFKGFPNSKLILMQCTTNYPSVPEDCNLRVIPTFAQAFNLPVGYSDHTQGLLAASLSIALGACVIERHFTLDKNLPGPDHSSSSEPEELAELVRLSRLIPLILGSNEKIPTQNELDNRFAMRRSIVAARHIEKGTIITKDVIAFKRPLNGLPPSAIDLLLGQTAICDIEEDSPLRFSHVQ